MFLNRRLGRRAKPSPTGQSVKNDGDAMTAFVCTPPLQTSLRTRCYSNTCRQQERVHLPVRQFHGRCAVTRRTIAPRAAPVMKHEVRTVSAEELESALQMNERPMLIDAYASKWNCSKSEATEEQSRT